jgi:Tfp pilus assembly protein PilF
MRVLLVLILALALTGCSTCAKKASVPPSGNKGVVKTVRQDDLNNAIMVFTKEIANNPRNAGAYYNRAKAYYLKKEYAESWKDVRKAESLGFKIDEKFLAKLKKASGINK